MRWSAELVLFKGMVTTVPYGCFVVGGVLFDRWVVWILGFLLKSFSLEYVGFYFLLWCCWRFINACVPLVGCCAIGVNA